jgi:hypothetical protein
VVSRSAVWAGSKKTDLYDLADTCDSRRFDDIACSFNVNLLIRLSFDFPVDAGTVHHRTTTDQDSFQRLLAFQSHWLKAHAWQFANGGVSVVHSTRNQDDIVALPAQFPRNVSTKKSGSPGDCDAPLYWL